MAAECDGEEDGYVSGYAYPCEVANEFCLECSRQQALTGGCQYSVAMTDKNSY